jgi:hypothetical protein
LRHVSCKSNGEPGASPASFLEADMRLAIALFVIIAIFLEPAWSLALPGAGI